MRFVFVRGDAQAALDGLRNELPDAQLLRPCTPLDWSTLPAHSVFIVPLRDQSTEAPAILKPSTPTSRELNT
jgi:hypothetical protein